MVMKCTVVSLVALAVLSSFCDAQRRDDVYRPSLPKYLRPVTRGKPVPRTPVPTDPQQSKQTFEQPLTWKYPEDPKPDVKPKPSVPFQLSPPVAVAVASASASASVAVACTETDAHVEVKTDFFGVGQLINAADLTLGSCGVTAVDTAAQVLIFTAQLQDCGSTLAMTEDALIYTFNLNYNPQPLGAAPVVRTNQVTVTVECHYPRKQNVSSLPLDPLWVPFSAVKVAEEYLYFTLQLMTDDWQNERPSYQYFLGDSINIQAVVKQYFHVPLRIYVDSCVAALTPDTTSTPRYAFIENYGCLIDAKITGSTSKFLARTVNNMLQFQMEAFKFQGDNTGVLYITCQLTATSATEAVDNEHRACSYINGIWEEASGADATCSSCDSGVTGPSGTFMTGPPGSGVPGSSGTGVPAYPGTGVPAYPSTGVPGSSGTGAPAYPSTGVPVYPGTGVPGSSGTGAPAYPSAGVSIYPGTGVPAYPGSGVPGSSGTGVPGSSGTGVPGSFGTGVPGSSGTGVPVYPGKGAYPGTGVPAYPGTGVTWGGSGTTKLPYRRQRDVSESEVFEWQGHVTLGPFHVKEKF